MEGGEYVGVRWAQEAGANIKPVQVQHNQSSKPQTLTTQQTLTTSSRTHEPPAAQAVLHTPGLEQRAAGPAQHGPEPAVLPGGAETACPAGQPRWCCASVGALPCVAMLLPCRRGPGWQHCLHLPPLLAGAEPSPTCRGPCQVVLIQWDRHIWML